MAARLLWEQEVPGSNPGAPTGSGDAGPRFDLVMALCYT